MQEKQTETEIPRTADFYCNLHYHYQYQYHVYMDMDMDLR